MMSDLGYPNIHSDNVEAPNGHDPDDTFEQDLRNMLRDGPNISDSPATMQSGGVHSPSGQFTGIDLSSPPRTTIPSSPRAISPSDVAASRLANQKSDAASKPMGDSMYKSSSPSYASSTAAYNPSKGTVYSSGSQYGSSQGSAGVPGSQRFLENSKSKLDALKTWGVSTYKCTRQIISEKLGRGSRTVDLQLEAQIEVLRDTQRKYANILRLSKALTNHFYQVVLTQRALGEAFTDLAVKSPELQEEFTYNAETQRNLCKNGETLLGALNFFTSNVNTLCNKTMEDTLITVHQYESARIEYDAYRTDMEALQLQPRDSATVGKVEEAKRKYNVHKEKFDKLRGDVAIKLRFLEENKVKVMQKQLLLFHNAISSYFSGNQQALEATLKQFSIKLKPPSENQPSFLETDLQDQRH
ncbi:arfaptin-2-like isoform X2 [Ptychodera flava]|uniref:arfaptin-2-like isoform X2 n=1 Tax=Ptychodera flava TaxID=63121 RepID=UPI00396A1021